MQRTFNNTSVAKTTLTADQMLTPTEHVITSPPTEQSDQDNASSSLEVATSMLNPYGHNDQLVVPGDNDDTSDEVVDKTAVVAGISSAAGISVLVPLLVFVFKRLYGAAKVIPKPDG